MKRMCAVLLILASTVLYAQQSDPRSALITDRGLTPADFPKLKKLMDNIYVFSDLHSGGFGYMTNDLIVITNDGVLIADGQGTPAVTQKLVDQIHALTPQPIKYMIVGSDHGDHTGGNSVIPKDVVFISSPASKKTLEDQAASQVARGGKSTTVVPTETVSDKRVLKMGSTEIQILNNGRAHTGGDIEVYLPKQRIAFLSEVFDNHVFPSMRTAYPSEWIATLKKCSAIDADVFVPGHGFVDDPKILKEEMTAEAGALTYIVTEATLLHKLGLSVKDATAQANWGPYKTWTNADRNAPIAIQRVYDELEGKLK